MPNRSNHRFPWQKSLRLALALIFIGLMPAPLNAHPVPFSYLDLRLGQGQLEGSLTVHIIDLAHDLNVTPPEALLDASTAESKREAILTLLRPRLLVSADDLSISIPSFDPCTSGRTFKLLVSDVGMIIFLPSLISRLAK